MSYTLLQNSGLDLNIAVFLAEASQAAYEFSDADVWAKAVGFSGSNPIDHENIQAFWCVQDDVALMVFRGTHNTGQWLRNARFFPVSHPWGWVHDGFKAGIEDIAGELTAFEAAAANAKHVWISGHSLGGALALMMAARLKIRQGIKASLYTYGQPMVGLEPFADRFAIELPGNLVRFVNQSDIVPRVPPGFSHTGLLKRIVRPGVLQSMPVLQTMALNALAMVPADNRASVELATLRLNAAVLESEQPVADSGLNQPLMIDSELSPLTAKQFHELQIALDVSPDQPQLEGIFPWFSDHSISEYIHLLTDIRDNS